ncbi:uncharacterized protein LOC130356466 [Hyla sarda]|uniref:uncharacterized protein LOC130356463 n=1 Tax=Hyla sarda TaxID=327740 RepID=UPI0024C2428E|nr:uncharacterized protein LOC130356463 [Hyla sarda]XP_056414032.1 uncharacterized protein LOC130356466 [Hyla sarda]
MEGYLAGSLNLHKWAADAADVFSEQESDKGDNDTVSLKSLFRELYEIYKDNLKSFWEVQSLEHYLKNNIVPKGLRVNILPAERSRTDNLLKKWEQEALASSFRFMNILLDEERIALDNSSKRLKESIDAILRFKTDPEFTRREAVLESLVDKFYTLLKNRKHKQFIRDLSEFREKRAFVFQEKTVGEYPLTEASTSDLESSDSERRGDFVRPFPSPQGCYISRRIFK